MTSTQMRLEPEASGPQFVDPTSIANRYEVIAVLGRGGMASVYRVRDTSTGNITALKRLCKPDGQAAPQISQQLFEREFQTLVQLQHPRIVRAYDYGLDGDIPFYTMEILDGGDVRELAPMSEADVCQMAYEVCSALSLLHSRRLVHRDLTPRNVRKTTSGKAKLIDFGVMSPMEPNQPVAGTPAYLAPELLNGLTLDARSDLFSLGGTMYFALTGFHAYPARNIGMLKDVWRRPPKAPSARGVKVSEGLDALVLSLLRIDMGSRPKSAAEVMGKLQPMLSLPPDETLTVANAFLTSPQLVGRATGQVRVRKQLLRSARGRGGGFLVRGAPGTGRSRFIDLCALEGKLLGSTVARANAADAASGPFGIAQAMAGQLHRADSSRSLDAAHRAGVTETLFVMQGKNASLKLRDFQDGNANHSTLQVALRAWILSMAEQRAVALLIDDLDQADAPSLALFAALSLDTVGHRITLIGAADDSVAQGTAEAFGVLDDHLSSLTLAALEPGQTLDLLRGVFGDIPNLTGLSERIHGIAVGLPRETMMLAQHLTDSGAIRYAEGAWTLPAVFDEGWLPATIGDALSAQVRSLSAASRQIGLYLALGVHHSLSRTALEELMNAVSTEVDGVLAELRSAGFVVGGPRGFMLRHGAARKLFTKQASVESQAASHDALAKFYIRDGACTMVVSFHELQGSQPGAGLGRILEASQTLDSRVELVDAGALAVGGTVAAETIDLAHREARRLGYGLKDLCSLWVTLAGMSASGESPSYYYSVPDSWIGHLKDWSGHNDLHALPDDMEPGERAVTAFSAAAARYEAAPEGDRVMSPVDAIRQLAGYVVFAIAVGSRTSNLELVETLPALLQPFCPLSPVVDAMYKNSLATLAHRRGQKADASAQFLSLTHVLPSLDSAELKYIEKIRTAMVHAINLCSATIGIQELFEEETLQADLSHQVGLHYIKRIMAMQRGDWEVAETHRHDAELTALQNGGGGMFTTLAEEFGVCGNARDLPGLKAAIERAAPLAAAYPRWNAQTRIAEANYRLLRGDPDQALSILATVREGFADEDDLAALLFVATPIEVSALAAKGEFEQAVTLGRRVLLRARVQRCFHFGRDVANALALAESASGQTSQAKDGMLEVLAEQRALGISGLLLGRTYSTLARIAIRAADVPEFEGWARLTAEQYRPGESSVLGQLYEQLIEESQRGIVCSEVDIVGSSGTTIDSEILTHVHSILSHVESEGDQAEAALELLCEQASRRSGFLFLLTDSGLSLLASNEDNVDRKGLQAFAEAQLELQLDDDLCTLTSGDFDLAAAESAAASTFVAGDGTTYLPLPLGAADADDNFQFVGIAFVSDAGEGRHRLDALVAAVARHLLTNPSVRRVAAA